MVKTSSWQWLDIAWPLAGVCFAYIMGPGFMKIFQDIAETGSVAAFTGGANYDEAQSFHSIHRTFAAFFACMLIIDLVSLIQTRTKLVEHLLRHLLFINTLPFLVYTSLSLGVIGVSFGTGGTPVILLRYVQWFFSTPTLILLTSRLGGELEHKKSVTIAMVVDAVMVWSGYLATVMPWYWTGAAMFFVSMVSWIYVMRSLWIFATNAIDCTLHKSDAEALRAVRLASNIVWSLFPVVWVLLRCGLVGNVVGELLFCVCDISAKMVFSLLLRAGSFMSIERTFALSMAERESAASHPRDAARKAENATRMIEMSLHEGHDASTHRAFLRAMSHELLTPLNEIMNVQEDLLEAAGTTSNTSSDRGSGTGSGNGAPDRSEIESSLKAIVNLRRTMGNALTYSEMQGGTLKAVPEPIDVCDVIETTVSDAAREAAFSGIRLTYARNGPVPRRALADRAGIELAVSNLIDNAVKFSRPEPRAVVEINVEIVRDPLRGQGGGFDLNNGSGGKRNGAPGKGTNASGGRASSRSTGKGKDAPASGAGDDPHGSYTRSMTLRVTVRDYGVGIVEEDIERAFLPFEQVGGGAGSLIGRPDGSGLGLTLARGYAEILGGDVRLDSVPGEGTIAAFTFAVRVESPKPGRAMETGPELADDETIRADLEGISLYVENPYRSDYNVAEWVRTEVMHYGVRVVSDVRAAAVILGTCSDEGWEARRIGEDPPDSLDLEAMNAVHSEARATVPVVPLDKPPEGRVPFPLTRGKIAVAMRKVITFVHRGKVSKADDADTPLLARANQGSGGSTIPRNASKQLSGVTASNTTGSGKGSDAGSVDSGGKTAAATVENPAGKPSPSKRPAVEGSRDFSHLHVLVVDDIEINRKIVTKLLRKAGVVEILTADDGDTAVDVITARGAAGLDLVLMDVSMPRVDGIEATRQVRELQQNGTVGPCKIVGLTAHTDSETRANMCRVGMDGVHYKPVSLKEIVSLLTLNTD